MEEIIKLLKQIDEKIDGVKTYNTEYYYSKGVCEAIDMFKMFGIDFIKFHNNEVSKEKKKEILNYIISKGYTYTYETTGRYDA